MNYFIFIKGKLMFFYSYNFSLTNTKTYFLLFYLEKNSRYIEIKSYGVWIRLFLT